MESVLSGVAVALPMGVELCEGEEELDGLADLDF